MPLPSRGRPVFGAVTGLFLPPVAGTPPLALAPKLVVGVIAAGAGPATLSPMAGTIAPSRRSHCMVSRAEDVLRSRRRSKTLSPPSAHFAARPYGLERTTENERRSDRGHSRAVREAPNRSDRPHGPHCLGHRPWFGAHEHRRHPRVRHAGRSIAGRRAGPAVRTSADDSPAASAAAARSLRWWAPGVGRRSRLCARPAPHRTGMAYARWRQATARRRGESCCASGSTPTGRCGGHVW